jgi:hypothetical protein
MENRQLFIHVMDELQARVASTDEYTLLGAGRLLRQLLLDATPLVDAVVGDQPIKLTDFPGPPKTKYEIGDYTPLSAPETIWSCVLDDFDPEYGLEWRHLHGGLGYHRKYAIELLKHGSVRGVPRRSRRRGRPQTYDARVIGALRVVAESASWICGKRLAPGLADLVLLKSPSTGHRPKCRTSAAS